MHRPYRRTLVAAAAIALLAGCATRPEALALGREAIAHEEELAREHDQTWELCEDLAQRLAHEHAERLKLLDALVEAKAAAVAGDAVSAYDALITALLAERLPPGIREHFSDRVGKVFEGLVKAEGEAAAAAASHPQDAAAAAKAVSARAARYDMAVNMLDTELSFYFGDKDAGGHPGIIPAVAAARGAFVAEAERAARDLRTQMRAELAPLLAGGDGGSPVVAVMRIKRQGHADNHRAQTEALEALRDYLNRESAVVLILRGLVRGTADEIKPLLGKVGLPDKAIDGIIATLDGQAKAAGDKLTASATAAAAKLFDGFTASLAKRAASLGGK